MKANFPISGSIDKFNIKKSMASVVLFSSDAWGSTDYSSPDQILGIILLVGVIVIAFFKMTFDAQKLDDPNDTSVVYLDQIASVAKLKVASAFGLRIYRQSGYLQQDDREFSALSGTTDPNKVIAEAIKTFRRAKIDYVVIDQNTETILEFSRPYHDHRGVKEGKKVGSCVIIAIDN